MEVPSAASFQVSFKHPAHAWIVPDEELTTSLKSYSTIGHYFTIFLKGGSATYLYIQLIHSTNMYLALCMSQALF